MTRQMSRGSQVAFGKAWLERQGIEAQTVDVHSHIDSSLSYEENTKNLKKILGLGGRSKQKAARGLTAAECDVAIGNFEAGFNHEVTRDACRCGHPDACETEVAAAPKAAPTPKKVVTTKFKTIEAAERWLEKKYAEHGGRWKFQATPEYKKVHPHLLELYGRINRQRAKESKQVNIVKNPYGTGYVIQFAASTGTYAGGGGMMGGLSTFETVDKAVREAKRSGYKIMSKTRKPKTKVAAAPKPKPKATKPKAKKTAATPKLTATQREYLAIHGFVKVKRGGKFIKITK